MTPTDEGSQRPDGSLVQRRRRGAGRRGETRSIYLSPDTWRDLEAVAGTLGWTVSRTADRLIACWLADYREGPSVPTGHGLTQPDLVRLAHLLLAFDMRPAQGVNDAG